jgi:hypothetical protein
VFKTCRKSLHTNCDGSLGRAYAPSTTSSQSPGTTEQRSAKKTMITSVFEWTNLVNGEGDHARKKQA